MGRGKSTTRDRRRQPRSRTCLCRGCGRQITPKTWNQRFCGDAACVRAVKRWQARKRQQKRRSTEDGRRKHRDAERERRRRRRCTPAHDLPVGTPGEPVSSGSTDPERETPPEPPPDEPGDLPAGEPPASTAAGSGEPAGEPPPSRPGSGPRGHATIEPEAMSGQPFCDRPGCFASIRPACRGRAHYCGHECRSTVRRVLDRERRWRLRGTEAGRKKRQHEYEHRRALRQPPREHPSVPP